MSISVVCLDRGTLKTSKLDFQFPHQLTEYDFVLPEEVKDKLKDQQVVVTNKVAIKREDFLANPQLKMIAVAATGYEHVDIETAREMGVIVCNVPSYSTDSVAEHAFMLMMALMRQLPAYQRDVAAGLWGSSDYFCHFGSPIRDINKKVLGIIGKGAIGLAFAIRAQAFGMKVVFAEHKNASSCREGYLPFDEVLAMSDVLSIHCPLNKDTRNLIDEAELKKMKPQSVLINVGRGGLVNESALVGALKYGQLGGAGFDVLTTEPPKDGNPLLSARLPNLIVTPHVAWSSDDAMINLCNQLTDNINAFVAGKPQCVVS